jgi:dihydroorotase
MPRARGTGPASPRDASADLVVAGRGWVGGALRPLEVGIDSDGWIRATGRSVRTRGRRIDLGDMVLLPAATDIHVHFRDPDGSDAAESFETGTQGAALGGVGAVGEMPNTRPPVTDSERWEDKAARARGRIAIDVVLYGAAQSSTAVRRLARVAGALKLYLAPTTGVPDPPDEPLPTVLRAVSDSHLPLSVHAEDPARFRATAEEPASTAAWNRLRPPESERAAVAALEPAPASLRLNVAHATLADTVDRARALGICCEATPHHLLLAARTDGGSHEKTNPPLRSRTDQRALWQRFAAGHIPLLASDHAPHREEAKQRSFAEAPSGVPGVETMLPLFLERVRAGELALPVLVAAAMDRPARWFGLPMGRIAPGHRANVIAVDFRQRDRVRGRDLRSPAGWSPFEGHAVVRPRWHLRGTEILVEDGDFVGPARGRVVTPEYAPSHAVR